MLLLLLLLFPILRIDLVAQTPHKGKERPVRPAS